MAEDLLFNPLGLVAEPALWQNFPERADIREKMLKALLSGLPAIPMAEMGLAADFPGNAFWHKKEWGKKTFLVPQRFIGFWDFFVRRATAANKSSGTEPLKLLLSEANCLLTGGPGTGKSYHLKQLVANLKPINRPWRIALTAPTGKAVARFDSAESPGNILMRATVHRLLGIEDELSPPRFGRDTPLPYDLVIVDEVSMLDLGLLGFLVTAMPATSRLILCGDLDQLPAVSGVPVGPALEFLREHGLICPITLHKTHRFSGERAEFYRKIAADGIAALVGGQVIEGIHYQKASDFRAIQNFVEEYVASRLASLPTFDISNFSECKPESIMPFFDWLEKGILLTVFREGKTGSQALNREIRERVVKKHGKTVPLPVIVSRNDYRLGLFNGEMGLLFPENAGQNERLVFRTEGRLKILSPQEFSGWEPAYALTVHKSQGSEFDTVWILYEETSASTCDNRLLYTAVTRSRNIVRLLVRSL